MDKVDQKIVSILKENSREKYVDIAHVVGLSEGAIRRRVKHLIVDGVITKFTIETKSNAEGVILIKTTPPFTKEVSQQLKVIADRVFEVSGDFDIAACITSVNMETLNAKIDKIRNLPYILDTKTLIRMTCL